MAAGVLKDIIPALQALPGRVQELDHAACGSHCEVLLQPGLVPALAQLMLKHNYYLCFVTAVHVQPALEVVYQFAHFEHQGRIQGKVSVPEDGTVPSIAHIYQGANWHERETCEMFGVVFAGHPNLTPLLLAEDDAGLHPMLKDPAVVKGLEHVRRAAGTPEDSGTKQE